jgi:hypothetical protein
MAKAKRGPGRPATGHDDVIGVRVPKAMIAAIDAIGSEAGGRSAAVRHLLQAALEQAGRLPRGKPKGVKMEPRPLGDG